MPLRLAALPRRHELRPLKSGLTRADSSRPGKQSTRFALRVRLTVQLRARRETRHVVWRSLTPATPENDCAWVLELMCP